MQRLGKVLNSITPLAILGGLGYVGMNSVYKVEAGHRAIVFNRFGGIGEKIYTEGMNFVVPWFQWPIIYDIRTRPRNLQSLTGSKDLQMVNMTVRVLYKPNSARLPSLYRELGKDYDERVLPSIVNEICKSIVAKYNANELLTKREMVSSKIRNALIKRGKEFNIYMDDVSITHLAFSREYSAAVEAKQVAAQDAQRAKYIVDKAILEKEQIIVKAQGEAESARLIGEAIKNNPGFLQLRRISVAKDISDIMSRSANKVFLDSNALLLNVINDEEYSKNIKK